MLAPGVCVPQTCSIAGCMFAVSSQDDIYIITIGLRAEFLLKTDSGYPREAGVFGVFGYTWKFLPLSHPLVSFTSLHPRPFGGPRKMSQSPVSHNSAVV